MTNKRCYKDPYTKLECIDLIKKMRKRQKRGKGTHHELRIYYCGQCKAHHLTSRRRIQEHKNFEAH